MAAVQIEIGDTFVATAEGTLARVEHKASEAYILVQTEELKGRIKLIAVLSDPYQAVQALIEAKHWGNTLKPGAEYSLERVYRA